MAEYYPLLAKAVGSLPNSTPETRRIVYERARKALIGQLRTLHPPVPEEDVEKESVELDRAIERLETELAAAAPAPAPIPADMPAPKPAATSPAPSGAPRLPPEPRVPLAPRKPIAPLRPRAPRPAAPGPGATDVTGSTATALVADAAPVIEDEPKASPTVEATEPTADTGRPRLEAQRPIAPQPPASAGPKRPIWILPTGIVVVVLLFGLAAWKLRVRPETIASRTPVPTVQAPTDSGKIADRVGGAPAANDDAPSPPSAPNPPTAPSPNDNPSKSDTSPKTDRASTPASQPAAPTQTAQQAPAAPGNPELPVAHRAAMLVEAPDLPSKVQTFPGTVVWKLNNVNAGPGDAVGTSVEADIDLPDDKTKATVTFEKNTDSSLPASHTIKVRFTVEPGSYSGDIKQISVPQMRREGNSDGEPLAGVTVPVIQNSFLVGLSPGNAETANLRLLADLPWIDVPILLTSGKIAKLTFEKGASGQRDISEALADWQKQ